MSDAPILWLIEHVARELDIATAATVRLRRQGVNMRIASLLDDLGAAVKANRPRIVLTPFFYSSGDFRVRELMALCPEANFVNLAFEHLYFNAHKPFKAPRDLIARNHVLHLAAADFFAAYLCEHGTDPGNVLTIGSLSCALYGPAYRSYFAPRADLAAVHDLDADRRWVFVPENYGAAFFSDRVIDDLVRRGMDRQTALDYRAFASASFDEAAKWWRDAAQQDNVELILRPRPATEAVTLNERLCRVIGNRPPHLHVIKAGSVREWILAADVVASSYSTTLVEAAWAGAAIVMFKPLEYPPFLEADWYQHCPQVRTPEQFLDAIESIDSIPGSTPGSGSAPGLRDWVGGDLMNHGDPIANVADILASILDDVRTAPPPPAASNDPQVTELLALHAARATPGPIPRTSDRMDRYEHDRLDAAETNRRIERWERVLD